MIHPARRALAALLLASSAAAGGTPSSWTGEESWEMGGCWEASGSGEVVETNPDSRSRTLSLGLARTFENGATTSLGTTISEDPAAELRTLGAELSAEAPLGPVSVSVDLTANSYRADVVQPARTERRRRTTVTFPSVTERMRLWEFHPSATLSLPLLGGAVTPSFSTGRSFFTEDPAVLSERLSELEFAPRAEQVAGHVDGFLSHDGEFVLDMELPAGFSVRGALGAERAAADGAWTKSRSLALSLDLGRLGLSAQWNRSLSYGERSDSWTGGLNWSFGGPPDEDDEEDESES